MQLCRQKPAVVRAAASQSTPMCSFSKWAVEEKERNGGKLDAVRSSQKSTPGKAGDGV